jgi:CDP-diacylglycerol--serine O-phosphatidyltransferase
MAVREPRKPRRELPVVKLLPNLLTLAAVCAGMTAIRFGFQGEFDRAVWLVLLAGVLDGLDGRLARLMRSQSLIGAELDSLADFLNFGIVPALLLYSWTLHEIGGPGWIAVLCYALCCLMRLARFNVRDRAGHTGPSDYFTGIPSPAGAILALQPMVLGFLFGDPDLLPPTVTAVYIVLVGFLMISRIPTPSFKNVTVYRDNARYVMLAAVLLLVALLLYPWGTLVAVTLVYIASVLVTLVAKARTVRRE